MSCRAPAAQQWLETFQRLTVKQQQRLLKQRRLQREAEEDPSDEVLTPTGSHGSEVDAIASSTIPKLDDSDGENDEVTETRGL